MARFAAVLRRLPVLVVSMALGLAPVSGLAEESVSGDKGTDMVIDLVVLRPLGLVATLVGAVGFIVSLPFTAPSGNVAETARELVVKPAEYTFNRPLGDMHRCGEDRHSCGER